MQKKCAKCNITKDIKQFPRDTSRSDGHYHTCRECHKVRMRAYFKTASGRAALERYLLKRARAKRKAKRMAWQHK